MIFRLYGLRTHYKLNNLNVFTLNKIRIKKFIRNSILLIIYVKASLIINLKTVGIASSTVI